MVTEPFSTPVKDSVAKVNDEIEVGENLDFQRKWWRFENVVWVLFTLIIVLDLAGLFGRGPIAKAERRSADGTIDVKYERIERTDSPSILTISSVRRRSKTARSSSMSAKAWSKGWARSGSSLRPLTRRDREWGLDLYFSRFQASGERRSRT